MWFGIQPEQFARKLIELRLDRELKATERKSERILERIKANPGDRNNLRLFDQLDRLNAKIDALYSALWPEPAPKSA
ncbi:MAG TPA: hypothetical protein DFS52_10320, partial [Myxococcales bacterium]|nr:hypothetical protein [Myxococcales bacterium]